MIENFRQALALLSPNERRGYWRILVFTAVAAVAQAVAIFSIMPFIVLLANPEIMDSNPLLIHVSAAVNAQSYDEFLVVLGSAAVLALLIGNFIAALEYWWSHRFLCRLGFQLEKRTLSAMLSRPYELFIERHGGELGNVIWNQVERVVDGVIGTSITIVGSAALAVFIVALLVVVNPLAAMVSLLGLLVLYLGVFLLLQRRVAEHGENLTTLNGELTASVKETLEGVKEIKTRRVESYFVKRFERSSLPLSRLALKFGILSFLPNFLLETLVIGALIGAALYVVLATQDAGAVLSLLALYAMATYRLVPSLKGVFEGVADLQHNVDAVRAVAEFRNTDHEPVEKQSLSTLTDEVRFEDVSYRYRNSDRSQLHHVSLSIAIGSSVCLFGSSGSGKSTLLNLLVGLIFPQQGRVCCDNNTISAKSVDAWRQMIGYCPQQIYLFDDSVARNITFGVEHGLIDTERVQQVCDIARIGDLNLDRVGQMLGDGGITLSGGQRQRVGIARALYPDPEVLIFDESFAGLDAANRDAILDHLFDLAGKTLVFSSHDPEVAARCDNVVVLEEGRVVAQGPYADIGNTLGR